jgi:hypothetical protein
MPVMRNNVRNVALKDIFLEKIVVIRVLLDGVVIGVRMCRSRLERNGTGSGSDFPDDVSLSDVEQIQTERSDARRKYEFLVLPGVKLIG